MGGCTTLTDLKTDISERVFGRDAVDPPAELVEFKPSLQPKIVWSTHLGESGDADFVPALGAGQVYAASGNGELVRLMRLPASKCGKSMWVSV